MPISAWNLDFQTIAPHWVARTIFVLSWMSMIHTHLMWPSNRKSIQEWPQRNLNTHLQAYFCLDFGFSKHSPAVSGKDGFCPHLDAYTCTSIVTLKSKIHPSKASATFHIFHYHFQWKMPGKYYDVFTWIYTEKRGKKQYKFFTLFFSGKQPIKMCGKCVKKVINFIPLFPADYFHFLHSCSKWKRWWKRFYIFHLHFQPKTCM
jgi:hypothetical protein